MGTYFQGFFSFSKQDIYDSINREDVLARQRFVLFRLFSISAVLASLGIFIKMYFMFSAIRPIHYVLPALTIISLLNFYSVHRSGQLERAYAVVLMASFTLLHIVAYSTGGIRSASILYYPVIILYAFMLLNKRYGQFFTALSCGQVLYIFAVSRFFPEKISFEFLNNDPHHIEEDFLFNGLFAFVLVSLQSVYLYSGRNVVIQKITEQRDQLITNNRELEQTNMHLQKTNRELDKFVYSVSHDLRAPLLSMQGMVQLMELDLQDEEQRQYMGLVKQSILKLDTFILDILAYSRNVRQELRPEPVMFEPLLNDITANLKFMGGSFRPVSIERNVKQEQPFGSDMTCLNVVLNNLISNAVRYQNPDQPAPFVRVDVTCTEGTVLIRISDNGIGIPEAYHERVFDMFFRVSENSIGSGLGLYLVKEAVSKLKGHIRLESKPGLGSAFEIHLPELQIPVT